MSTMLGRVFALSTDDEQAEFLNAVGAVMRTWKEPAAYDMQVFRILDHVNDAGREFIQRLYENLEARDAR